MDNFKGGNPLRSWRGSRGKVEVNDSDRICFQPTIYEEIDLRIGYRRPRRDSPYGEVVSHIGGWVAVGGAGIIKNLLFIIDLLQ